MNVHVFINELVNYKKHPQSVISPTPYMDKVGLSDTLKRIGSESSKRYRRVRRYSVYGVGRGDNGVWARDLSSLLVKQGSGYSPARIDLAFIVR